MEGVAGSSPELADSARAAGYIQAVGNLRSRKLHRPGCRWAKAISKPGRVVFASFDEAISRGYVACRVCMPKAQPK